MKFEELVIIPDKYKEACDKKGLVEKVYYSTKGLREEEYLKYCYVYLPYGYDPDKPYDIIYQLHGGGEICDRAFYKGNEATYKKHFCDHMIASGQCKPFIWVSVEWYEDNKTPKGNSIDSNIYFHRELVNDILPVIESHYHTYATFKTDKDSLKAAREHRIIMGWSMGSVTTWFTAISEDMAYFKYYNFESGDCWILGNHAGGDKPEETAQKIHDLILKNGFSKEDFVFYITTGSKDIAYPNLTPQVEAMKKLNDLFVFEGEDANCVYHVWPNGEHHTEWRRQYQFNAIKTFFGN